MQPNRRVEFVVNILHHVVALASGDLNAKNYDHPSDATILARTPNAGHSRWSIKDRDFRLKSCFISGTIQERAIVTMEHE